MTRLLALTALPAVLLPACVLAKVGDGQSATVESSYTGVQAFSLTTFLDTTVTVTPGGNEAAVSITCDDSLLDQLVADVHDGVLVLEDSAGYALVPRSDCHAEVDLPTLTALSNTGAGRLLVTSPASGLTEIDATGSGGVELVAVTTTDLLVTHTGSGPVAIGGLDAATVDVTNTGSGGTSLLGRAELATIRVTGSGGFGEAGFTVDDLVLTLTGSGGAELTVNHSVDVTLTGTGGATIHGDPPECDVQDTGTGDVHFE